jgi:alkanesulfonate monooxygenase SsuD/methylene tetrahydromethanopterin reductase-like flavin-dependent oxidoreductase (luciferase family)
VKFSIELPVVDPARMAEHARAIEDAGFDACFVTDHPAPPPEWLEHGGHVTVDPFVALSTAAAVTSTLRLHTHCLIPTYRHPLLTAKAVSTLDAVSGGRVIFGVAVGYLEAEFTALGVPFAERAALLDDALRVIQNFASPPIWVGGNSAAAMRRAIAYGTGWAPFPASPRVAAATGTADIADLDALGRAIERFRKLAAEAGRTDPLEICFTPFSHPAHKDVVDPDALVSEARILERLGVTWLAFHVPMTRLADFADAVIPRLPG